MLQRTEERVAMAGQHDIPHLAGQRRVRDVPDRALKNRCRIALDDDGLEPEPRDSNLANRTAVDQRGRRDRLRSRALESSLFDRLIDLRVGDDVRDVPERNETDH